MAALLRSGVPLQILRELAAKSPQASADLTKATGTKECYLCETMYRLRRDGLVALVYALTPDGLNAVNVANERGIADTRRKRIKRNPRKVVAHQYPVVTTDEQISELKRKAEADRSFGFESINGREARK